MARWQPAERDARFRKARKAGLPVVVSEGDSWFDYPMYLNLIDHVDDARRFAIKRLEFSGDTVKNMVGSKVSSAGVESLKAVVQRERPAFLLFSGAGNDIVGDELTNALQTYDATQSAAWHIDTPVWKGITEGVEFGYRMLIDVIGGLAPIVTHGYDHIVPANKKAKYDGVGVSGPWVWPEMERAKIDAAMRPKIGKEMMTWFNELLAKLEREFPDRFAYVDLRNTLAPNEWQNEIHPTREGFAKLAAKLLGQLDAKLAAMATARGRPIV